MAHEVPRSVVEAFYEVYAARDVEKIAEFLDDDVEWTICGPADLLAHCGTQRGKAKVIELIKHRVPQVMRTYSFVSESIVVDGDQAAMLSRQSARRTVDGRSVSYRVANFMRFRDGKVVENISLIDSFDAVEQLLGCQLAVGGPARAEADGLVAV